MQKPPFLPLLFLGLAAFAWLLGQRYDNAQLLAAALPLAPPPLDSTHQNLVDQFETYLLNVRSREAVPAMAVAVVKDSQVVFQRSWGVRSVVDSVPIDAHTVFRLASLSKGFAPVLAGILVEKGQLNWKDPLVKYLPDFRLSDPDQTRQLNLEHVLSHTTGLPRHTYSNLVNQAVPYEDILPMLADVPLAHPVGTYYNYQNVAYSLIGDVLEQTSGLSYADLMQQEVFGIAGMKNASTGFVAMDTSLNVAYPHRPNGPGYHRVSLESDWYTVAPAAGHNASITDMGEWLQVLMGNRPEIIADSTLETIFTPYVPVSKWENNLRSWRKGISTSWYGFGWRVMDYYDQRIVYHGGYVNSYRTEIAFDRERKIGLVILTNSPSSFMANVIPTFFDLYRETIGLNEDEAL